MEYSNARKAYAILMGRWPLSPYVSSGECMATVMEKWDGGKFDGHPYLERVGRMALCEIALEWGEVKASPHEFALVTERLREMDKTGFLGKEITLEHVRHLHQFDTDHPV